MRPDPATLGAILAGGLARRLGGGDKALRTVGGRTVLARLVERVTPQVTRLILNANDDLQRFAWAGLPVVADSLPGHPGPLAGVLAALDWGAACEAATDWVLTVPGDAPFLPRDLVSRLQAERRRTGATLACAASAGRSHPVVTIWPVSMRHELREALTRGNVRKVGAFIQRHPTVTVDWPAVPADPFFNVNEPQDLAEADNLATLHADL